MIEIVIKTRDKNILGFEVEGHANYAQIGQDIICAGVSALTFNSINTLYEIVKIKDNMNVVVNENEIILDVDANNIDKQKLHDTQVVLRGYELGIQSIIKEYEHSKDFEEFISLYYREV